MVISSHAIRSYHRNHLYMWTDIEWYSLYYKRLCTSQCTL